MKPLKSALFIAVVFLILGISFFFMPEEGMVLFTLHLRNPFPAGQAERVWHALTTGKSAVAPLPQVSPAADTRALSSSQQTKGPVTAEQGSPAVPGEGNGTKMPAALTFADSLLRAVPSIEMGDTTRLLLYRLLHDLDSLRIRRQRIHLLYYGDSQIEGDRITSLLRDTLQARFGGGGPGFFLPVMTVPYTAGFVTEPVGRWQKIDNYTFRQGRSEGIPFGLAGSFSLAPDDLPAGKTKHVQCRIAIHKFAPPRTRAFNRLEVWLYAPGAGPAVQVHAGRAGRMVRQALPAGQLLCERFALLDAGRRLQLDFTMHGPFAVEGLVLEDSVGVSVDNIPLRGRPFMMFSRCDSMTVSRMFDSLNVRMVVLQFGLNVAVGSMYDVRHYRRTVQRELRWLRQTFPGVFVLVVGVTDMGGEDPQLQKRLALIRREQRQTALAEGCAFWDAYRAMGGPHSIVRWAAQSPSLARPDQAHLSREGSQLFARMLLKAFMEDYQNYSHGL